MKTPRVRPGFWIVATAVLLGLRIIAAEAPPVTGALDEVFKPFAALLEKTWKADFKDSTPQKPRYDIMRWERALNGKAVRILHSINDGEYGGETLVTWDEGRKTLVFHYFTTAGYMTTGTMKVEDGKCVSRETVSGGGAGGVTEVKAVTEILKDGSYHVKSTYLKNGEWVPGHEFHYREAPGAKVLFR